VPLARHRSDALASPNRAKEWLRRDAGLGKKAARPGGVGKMGGRRCLRGAGLTQLAQNRWVNPEARLFCYRRHDNGADGIVPSRPVAGPTAVKSLPSDQTLEKSLLTHPSRIGNSGRAPSRRGRRCAPSRKSKRQQQQRGGRRAPGPPKRLQTRVAAPDRAAIARSRPCAHATFFLNCLRGPYRASDA
jgi:hypothetical protein